MAVLVVWDLVFPTLAPSIMSESRYKDITRIRQKEHVTSSLTPHTTPPHPERRVGSHLVTVTGGGQWSDPLA